MSDEGEGSGCGFFVGVGLGVAGLVALLLILAWQARGVGSGCERDEECNSHRCLMLISEGVCTDLCRTDDDCPSDMRCGTAFREGPPVVMGSTNERHVCVPTDR